MLTIEQLNAAKAKKNNDARRIKIDAYLANTVDCGRKGRAYEVKMTPSLSSKHSIASPNRRDNYVRVKMKDGKVKQCAIECKTSGGRVDSLFTNEYIVGDSCFTNTKFVSYQMEIVVKHKAGKHTPAWTESRETPALLIPKEVFVNALLSDKSFLKPMYHNGEQDGWGIQVSSKKWYQRLMDYADNYPDLVHNPDKVYEMWQFEGVEL